MSPKTTEACLIAAFRMILDAEIETAALRLLLTRHCDVDQEELDLARESVSIGFESARTRLHKIEGPYPLQLSDILERLEGIQ